MAITQLEIANKLGLSRQIVSQALRGHPGVAPQTRRRIQQAAQHLGYNSDSNREARALIARRYGKRLRTNIIVVASATFFDGDYVFTDPLAMRLLAGIQVRGKQLKYDILSCSPEADELPRLIRDRQVDGVICYIRNDTLAEVNKLDLPAISLGCPSPLAPGIVPDSRQGMVKAVQHLIELGHRQIAYIGFHPHYDEATKRLEGYREGMHEAGLTPIEALHPERYAGPDRQAGRTLVQSLMQEHKITGLICYNDLMAMGAIQEMQEAGLDVPGDVSVIGFDDLSQDYDFKPGLTSVSYDKFVMGGSAVDLLHGMIEESLQNDSSDETDENSHGVQDSGVTVLPTQLVIRDSTAAPRRPPKR